MVDIVHRGAADALVVPREAHRLDQVDRDPEAGAEPQHRADVAGDFGLEEGDPHGRRDTSARGPSHKQGILPICIGQARRYQARQSLRATRGGAVLITMSDRALRAHHVARVSMATLEETQVANGADDGVRRRDFINIAAVSFAGVGAAAVVLPLVSQMSPSADVLALASTEVDISKIAPGQAIKTSWRKQPVFVRNLTAGRNRRGQGRAR